MPFKRLVFLSELCPTEIRGPTISRLRRETEIKLKALKTSVLELDALGPPIIFSPDQTFGDGWKIDGKEILEKLITLELFDDTNLEPICFEWVSKFQRLTGISSWAVKN